jgi:hypothetical protein
MRLPLPSPAEVEEFRLLYEKRFRVTLTPDEALETATRLVQLFCLLNDEIYPLRKKK